MANKIQAVRKNLMPKVKEIPAQSGVYLMKNKEGRVIYVGKARNLRQRVGSYFSRNPDIRQQMLLSQIADVDFMITGSEVEALITENRLIKDYQPKYNVRLKDDKSYPYLKITAELYPRLELVRLPEKKMERNGDFLSESPSFFGPYTEVRAVRQTLRFLNKIFPLRNCRQPLEGYPRGRPCLNFQMRRCLGPCRGSEAVSPVEYGKEVKRVEQFLQGEQKSLVQRLQKEMNEAAARMEFEKAAVLRDRLEHLQKIVEAQKVLNLPEGEYDVLGLVSIEMEPCDNDTREIALVYMYRIREGRLMERENFVLEGTAGLTKPEIMSGFMQDYYSRGVLIPPEIIISHLPAEEELVKKWLEHLYGKEVKLYCPQSGSYRNVLERCLQEGYTLAREKLKRGDKTEKAKEEDARQSLEELSQLFGIKKITRIEGYDISHLQGGEAVGSMVVFQEAFPFTDGYRRFRIREFVNGDDYRAMEEILRRRFKHTEMPFPELILVDGGEAQLKVLQKVTSEANVQVAVLALAKREEKVYVPGKDQPLQLSEHSSSLRLLRRVRDEAHRFANSYHRKIREKTATASVLDNIPGVGKKRKIAILQHFGSMDAVVQASPADIARVPGVGRNLAQVIHDFLHRS